MKQWFPFLPIILFIALISSCQNSSLKKVKVDQLDVIIINDGNQIGEFWKHFESNTKIRVHAQTMHLDSFIKKASKEGYNLNADVIYMPNVRTLATLHSQNLLQSIPNLKYVEVTDEQPTKDWIVLGLNPYITSGDKALNSYSDLKSNGTWQSILTESELKSFYHFAKLHFKDDKKFGEWKTVMEEKRTEKTTTYDSIYRPVQTLTLYNKENKNPQLTNLQGAGMFYDFSTVGIYPHAKNYMAAKKFVEWMIKPAHAAKISEALHLVPTNYSTLSGYKHFKFHRISPEYLLKSAESSLSE